MKKTAVVICPGRGTYNAAELGYVQRHHGPTNPQLAQFDAYRTARGRVSVSDLDGADRFSARTHTRGDTASPLIYAASFLDARAISDDFDVVAVTGNSMGWYSALAVAGVVSPMAGFEIVDTMGTLMQDSLIGGQSLYPFVDDGWREIPANRAELLALVSEIGARENHHLSVSIHLGGMLVVAGDAAGLAAFEASVPPVAGRYPMRLPNHAAFHTSLQAPIAARGQARLGPDLFDTPDIALVDGRGAVWLPKSCTPETLRAFTLGHQVVEPYDFTAAVQVAAKSFAPDVFIITGPGTTLGGAVAQSLIGIGWGGIKDKDSFQHRQVENPILISMGRDDQRPLATGS